MKKIMLIGAILVFVSILGCYNDKYDQLYVSPPNATCDTTAVSFSKTIVPILNANCSTNNSACHNAQSTYGYNFTTYSGVQAVASYSFMINDINGTPTRGHNSMPLNLPKISQCDINTIAAWIDQGALNN